jgi:hypothetical protein
VTDLLHDLSHLISPLAAGVAALTLTAATLVLLRRRAWLVLGLLGVPGLAALLLAVDLDATTEIPHLLQPVPFAAPGVHRFDAVARQSAVWERRVCLGLQFVPGLPPDPIAADLTLFAGDDGGRPLAARTIAPGAWHETFGPRGDGGAVCFRAPARFTVGAELRRGDRAFEGHEVRLVVAVPRHDIVCPERLRGAALAGAIPLLLGAGGGLLVARGGRPRQRRGGRTPAGAP